MLKKVLIITAVIITGVAGVSGYFLFIKDYTTYAQCVKYTGLPCKHYYVGDFGEEWRPSPYRSREECETDPVTGFSCIVPPGNFREERWINGVDLEKAKDETPQQKSAR